MCEISSLFLFFPPKTGAIEQQTDLVQYVAAEDPHLLVDEAARSRTWATV
jgi:hypothetical protein